MLRGNAFVKFSLFLFVLSLTVDARIHIKGFSVGLRFAFEMLLVVCAIWFHTC
jgi:hypothetical protein